MFFRGLCYFLLGITYLKVLDIEIMRRQDDRLRVEIFDRAQLFWCPKKVTLVHIQVNDVSWIAGMMLL